MASTQVEGGAATKAEESVEALPPKIVEEKEAQVVVHEVDRDDDDHKDKLPDEEEVENAEKDQIASPLIEAEPDPDASCDDEAEADDQLDDD